MLLQKGEIHRSWFKEASLQGSGYISKNLRAGNTASLADNWNWKQESRKLPCRAAKGQGLWQGTLPDASQRRYWCHGRLLSLSWGQSSRKGPRLKLHETVLESGELESDACPLSHIGWADIEKVIALSEPPFPHLQGRGHEAFLTEFPEVLESHQASFITDSPSVCVPLLHLLPTWSYIIMRPKRRWIDMASIKQEWTPCYNTAVPKVEYYSCRNLIDKAISSDISLRCDVHSVLLDLHCI